MRTSIFVRSAAMLGLLLLFTSCPQKGSGGPPPVVSKRCEVDLKASGLFAQTGSGASARVIDADAMLIGGEGATGRQGDVLLQNDKIRVVIEQPGRSVGPILSGGGIIDADLVRSASEPGRDAFGRMGLIYAFGRIISVTSVEVLSDGASGGPAVVAATGHDAPHDLINFKSLLASQAGLSLSFVVDPDKPLPLKTTTYFVLSPGESRVRMLTAFCNEGPTNVLAPIVELQDVGAFELFNPGGCKNGVGSSKLDPSSTCILEPSKWFGTQADGVAYGFRSHQFNDPARPVVANGMLGYGGVVGNFIEGENLKGLLSWTDADARTRPGTFSIRAGGQKSFLRDFVVASDLAGVSATFLGIDSVATGKLVVDAVLADGAKAAGARISVVDAAGTMTTLMVADANGRGTATLAPGDYQVSAALEGHLIGEVKTVSIAAGQTASLAALSLAPARTLAVSVVDPAGAPMPAKVTVVCAGGAACSFSPDTYRQHLVVEQYLSGAAAVGYVPVTGKLNLNLPPGEYEVVVSRGPEYSVWPDTWPGAAHRVDLRTADQAVSAVLGQVVNSTGWMSADLHVHAVASSDSAVGNALRAANFLAEGVDVLLSTDHDVITDFAPTVKALGAESFIATMIGAEVTTFSHGHFNAFPLVRNPSLPYGGAFDHAAGEDQPTYRLTELFPTLRAQHPGAVVQINHPRGGGGALTLLKVDTATLASHGDPKSFNMAAAPDATANDTKVFGDGWDALETANGPGGSLGILNDWMTFLSRGTVRTSTGVSDTHTAYSSEAGYARTYAHVGVDRPADFSPARFADAIRTQKAFVTNGPFLKLTARKLDSAGLPVGPAVEVGGTASLSPAAGEGLELTVDIQAPEWMQFDRVELYSHAPGREAVNGETNSTWPEGRILDKHLVDPLTWLLEPVPGALPLRRVHLVEKFIVKPTQDTWFVAMVRSSGGRTLWPLHGDRAMAWTNAILVDANGTGKYDDFPLKPGQPLRAPYPVKPLVSHVPTPEEFTRALVLLLDHPHK